MAPPRASRAARAFVDKKTLLCLIMVRENCISVTEKTMLQQVKA
jgi:hypothetical protein